MGMKRRTRTVRVTSGTIAGTYPLELRVVIRQWKENGFWHVRIEATGIRSYPLMGKSGSGEWKPCKDFSGDPIAKVVREKTLEEARKMAWFRFGMYLAHTKRDIY